MLEITSEQLVKLLREGKVILDYENNGVQGENIEEIIIYDD